MAVARTRFGTRALNERFLDRHGISPRTLVLGSNGAIKRAVREGLGISLLSRAAVATERRTMVEGSRIGPQTCSASKKCHVASDVAQHREHRRPADGPPLQ